MNETQLVKQCLEWLLRSGYWSWRNNTGAVKAAYKGKSRMVFYGKKGSGDIQGYMADFTGRGFWVECKVGKNKQTAEQQIFERGVIYHNGVYILAYSLDEMIDKLKEAAQ